MLNMKENSVGKVDLFGTKRGASYPDCAIYDHTANDYVDVTVRAREIGPGNHPAEIIAFADAVTNNKPVPVPPTQSRAVMAILEGLYKSQKTGKEVKL
jgi:predicted dehydrogenase